MEAEISRLILLYSRSWFRCPAARAEGDLSARGAALVVVDDRLCLQADSIPAFTASHFNVFSNLFEYTMYYVNSRVNERFKRKPKAPGGSGKQNWGFRLVNIDTSNNLSSGGPVGVPHSTLKV